jgi:hypothetical protein
MNRPARRKKYIVGPERDSPIVVCTHVAVRRRSSRKINYLIVAVAAFVAAVTALGSAVVKRLRAAGEAVLGSGERDP